LPGALRLNWPQTRPDAQQARCACRNILRYGLPLFGWFSANQILNLSDRFFLQGFRGATEVGLYGATYSFVVGFLVVCYQPLLTAAFPLIVKSWQQGEKEKADRNIRLIFRYLLTITPFLIGWLFLMGKEVLSILLDESYLTSASLIGILGVGLSLWHCGLYWQKVLELHRRTGRLFRLLATAAAGNVLANIVLIPLLGKEGAALGTVLGYGIYAFTIYRAANQEMKLPWPSHLLVSLTLAVLGMFATGWGILRLIQLEPVGWRLLLGSTSCLGVYTAILYFRGDLQPLFTLKGNRFSQ